jgi:hypothetical protein
MKKFILPLAICIAALFIAETLFKVPVLDNLEGFVNLFFELLRGGN